MEKINTELPTKSKMSRINYVLRHFHSFIVVILVMTATITLISALNLPGGYRIFTVLSGSMEPVLHTGSIVVTVPADSYSVGDIITYYDQKTISTHPGATFTHRIIDTEYTPQGHSYKTKGDANDGVDSDTVVGSHILGRVVVIIPFVGYFIYFVKTLPGLILFIIVPSLLFILSELFTIISTIRELKSNSSNASVTGSSLSALFLGVGLVSFVNYYVVSLTNAFISTDVDLVGLLKMRMVEPQLEFSVNKAIHSAQFTVGEVGAFSTLEYILTYETADEQQGVVGTASLTTDSFTKSDIVLGTCSEACTYHKNPHDFELTVTLTEGDGTSKVLSTQQ